MIIILKLSTSIPTTYIRAGRSNVPGCMHAWIYYISGWVLFYSRNGMEYNLICKTILHYSRTTSSNQILQGGTMADTVYRGPLLHTIIFCQSNFFFYFLTYSSTFSIKIGKLACYWDGIYGDGATGLGWQDQLPGSHRAPPLPPTSLPA